MAAAILASGAASGCKSDLPSGPDPASGPMSPSFTITPDGGVTADKDTYLRQGAPNQNQGADTILRIQASGNNRILVAFSTSDLVTAVAGKSLVSAKLVFKISDNADNWGTTGRLLDIHRLTSQWTELGATWNCAVDAVPTNGSPNCSGSTQWEMNGPSPRPWVTTPSASVLITNGLSGSVTIDVTADVAAFLAGSAANYGWIVKKQNEGATGHIEFSSRETATPPRLVLEIAGGGGPSGLVAFYRLDGDGVDATANANHGTVSGATSAVGRGGLAATALEFSTGGDEVRVPSNSVIRGLTSEITVVVWMKRGASDITPGMIPIARRDGVPIHFELYGNDGGFAFQCCSTESQVTGSYFVPTGTGLSTINDGQWHQVAATRRFGVGGFTELYLDGMLLTGYYSAGSADDAAADMIADFLIGHQESASPGQYIGLLDDVMIFNRVLTQTEIQSIP